MNTRPHAGTGRRPPARRDSDRGPRGDEKSPERRKFSRFEAGLEVDVAIETDGDVGFLDHGRTIDVSGEGVRFFSKAAARYRQGQAATLKIRLPAVDGGCAHMKGTGRVVRVKVLEDGNGRPGGQGEVAVHLIWPLRFFRSSGGAEAPKRGEG